MPDDNNLSCAERLHGRWVNEFKPKFAFLDDVALDAQKHKRLLADKAEALGDDFVMDSFLSASVRISSIITATYCGQSRNEHLPVYNAHNTNLEDESMALIIIGMNKWMSPLMLSEYLGGDLGSNVDLVVILDMLATSSYNSIMDILSLIRR